MSKAPYTIPCENCGEHFYPHYKKRRLSRFCGGECYSESRSIPNGVKIGRLTSLGLTKETDVHHRRLTRFLCDCGKEVLRQAKDVQSGNTHSCGCLHDELAAERAKARATHGMSNTPEHAAFCNARLRCNESKDKSYKNYGGRGIEFRFSSWEEWFTELGPRPGPEYSVDRINNDGHYEPGNVRWADRETQANNRREARRPP